MSAPADARPSENERTSLASHVDLCELRYRSLDARVKRIEWAVYALFALIMFGREHLIDILKLLAPRVIVAAALGLGPALAAPPPGADPNSPVAQWFHGLRTPDTGTSCCDLADCRHLPTRVGKAGYEVRVPALDGEIWVPVPPDKILPHKDNPTGEPVTCYSPWQGVMCFIEGAGT
jgi:hypothetical protein